MKKENDGDLRGFAYALTRDGQVITSGSFPTEKYMAASPEANIEKFLLEAQKKGLDLYVGGYPGASAWTSPDGLIFGMTFAELSAKQQRQHIPSAIKGKMPVNAIKIERMVQPQDDLVWPLVSKGKVFHVGSMEISQKGAFFGSSLEGNGLSVSQCPDEWRQIARLGNSPQWTLSNKEGKFIDALEMSTIQWNIVMAWSAHKGLVVEAEIWKLTTSGSDEDGDFERYSLYDPQNPIDVKNVESEMEDKDNCVVLGKLQGFKATQNLNERVNFDVDLCLVKDMALTVYVEDVLFPKLGVQGVWWDETMNPDSFSAPRGVIHLSALPQWDVKPDMKITKTKKITSDFSL